LGISQQQLDLSKEQLELQKSGLALEGYNAIRDIEKSIVDLEGAKIQYGIDIRDAKSQVESYDKWLGNYEAQYAQEVQSKQAQTDQLVSSGRESYENFLNAIGYADAAAGASGRVGAGTSQSMITGGIDRKLVDYVGEDRTLDANGGLFGSQLTAANMEMDQLKLDLEFQRFEMAANRDNMIESIADWEYALQLTDENITKSRAVMTELEKFIGMNFGDLNYGDVNKGEEEKPLGISSGMTYNQYMDWVSRRNQALYEIRINNPQAYEKDGRTPINTK